VSLHVSIAPETPAVDADPARLGSVVGNLVSNALRHTPRGGTVVVAARRAAAGVELTVSDDGEGIAPDLVPRVFDRFVKGPGSTGSGLGLAIVRDVVEAHGGAVAVESRAGQGTTFRITLPAASA
jgi:signal transduction histidine kinase